MEGLGADPNILSNKNIVEEIFLKIAKESNAHTIGLSFINPNLKTHTRILKQKV